MEREKSQNVPLMKQSGKVLIILTNVDNFSTPLGFFSIWTKFQYITGSRCYLHVLILFRFKK